jgi:recombinational DNA repair protein (RecF pathway)
MYQKYQTEALVLRSYERGEADRVYALYTREFGLVWGRASAVRRESSRMRYALQNYAHAKISLVRGTSGWRVAGASAMSDASLTADAGSAFARVAQLVDRLVAGEGMNEYLFQALVDARSALIGASREMHSSIELLCVARILYSLGYLSAPALGTALFAHTAYASEAILETEALRPKLLSSVNKALSETHL